MKNIILETWQFLCSGFFSALLGAFSAFLGVIIGIKSSNKSKLIDDICRKIRILHSMHDEFKFLLERYKNVYGNIIKNSKEYEPIAQFSVSKEDYFIVYLNNSEIIGDIKSERTREAIIRSYILSKAIMEEFEINNSIYDNLEKTENKNDILRQLFDYKSVIFEDNNKIIDYGEISINGLNDEILILRKKKKNI
ncbi:hypothetical protein, partial [Gluconobacter kondonii]|uniref:hypothetical protein n=1 Tax=Gluconobacter kondonii TaxID=941463 RepID=UPI00197D44F7